MLFPYKYITHSMEKMQGYLDFIFYEVWCKAAGTEYDVETLFATDEELQQIVIELHTSEVSGADFFLTGLQQIFEDFKELDANGISQFQHWYKSNNSIEELCANDPTLTPATYNLISEDYSELSSHLKDFFKNLYSQSFLSLKSISSRIGEIEDHYQKFVEINTKAKCPFCGISDLHGCYHSKREAYDHFLPKSRYPFISINFQNLAPACHTCNSTYKSTHDPAFRPKTPAKSGAGVRRKAFYPFSTDEHVVEIDINVCSSEWTNIQPSHLEIQFGPADVQEQIETWLDVYGIEERYKAKCCEENDGKYWLEQVLDEWKEDGKKPGDFLKTLSRLAKRKPFADANFLKTSFLEGCNRAGLFNEV